MPVAVPVTGPVDERLATTAGATAVARGLPRGGSAALLTPAFRCLAALGLFRWFIERQRLVHTFVTNLRGPTEQLFLAGAPVGRIVPLTVVAGNVSVAFAVLSYAGRLGITVVCDPDHWPDTDLLPDHLKEQLDTLIAGHPGERSAPQPAGR